MKNEGMSSRLEDGVFLNSGGRHAVRSLCCKRGRGQEGFGRPGYSKMDRYGMEFSLSSGANDSYLIC